MKHRVVHTLNSPHDINEMGSFELEPFRSKDVWITPNGVELTIDTFDAAEFLAFNLVESKPKWLYIQAEAILAKVCTTPDFKQTMQNLKDSVSNPVFKLAYYIVCRSNRSHFISKQTENYDYSNAVPGIMGVAKRYNGIPYTAWDIDLEDKDTWGLMSIGFNSLMPFIGMHQEYHNKFGNELLNEFRAKQPDPAAWKLVKVDNRDFDILPNLFRRLLLRMWVWNTTSDYVVYNLDNFDKTSPLKISSDVFKRVVKPKKIVTKSNDDSGADL